MGFGTAYTKNVDWQSSQCLPLPPALSVSSSETRVSDCHSAPGVEFSSPGNSAIYINPDLNNFRKDLI